MTTTTAHTRKETGEHAPMLYDRPQAAARLAISLRTLDEQIQRQKIRVTRIGRAVRITPAALESFIEASTRRWTRR